MAWRWRERLRGGGWGGRDGRGWDPDEFTCDVWAFQDALDAEDHPRALRAYGGDLLPGFFLNGNREFENWLEARREHLRECAAGAAWRTAHALIAQGDLVEAERTAQRAFSLVWSDETPVRRFIQDLAEAGDRSAALRFFEKFCQRLKEELDLEPSPGNPGSGAGYPGTASSPMWRPSNESTARGMRRESAGCPHRGHPQVTVLHRGHTWG